MGKREREVITHARRFSECCIYKLFTGHSELNKKKLSRLQEPRC